MGEVVDAKQVRFAELDTSVEEATNVSTYYLYQEEMLMQCSYS